MTGCGYSDVYRDNHHDSLGRVDLAPEVKYRELVPRGRTRRWNAHVRISSDSFVADFGLCYRCDDTVPSGHSRAHAAWILFSPRNDLGGLSSLSLVYGISG